MAEGAERPGALATSRTDGFDGHVRESTRHRSLSGRRSPSDNDVVRVLIIGAGGHAAELVNYFEPCSRLGLIELAGLLDDAAPAGPFGPSAIVGRLADLP